MATTSPDNLWSPDGGDAYALTTDLAAMQDTNQTAFTALRSGLVMRRGTDAERLDLSGSDLFEGLHFWTTDTRQEWIYTNSSWTLSGQIQFTNLSFSSGWTTNDFGSRPAFGLARYTESVVLRGVAKRSTGTIDSASIIGVLPVGYRPPSVAYFLGQGGGLAYIPLQVDSSGEVRVKTAPSVTTPWVSLDGISFPRG